MLFPIVCLSCNKRLCKIAAKHSVNIADGMTMQESLNDIGLNPITNLCCRRIFLSQADLAPVFIRNDDRNVKYTDITIRRSLECVRTLQCQ